MKVASEVDVTKKKTWNKLGDEMVNKNNVNVIALASRLDGL